MIFRKAKKEELSAVAALYESVKGEPLCTWEPQYPTRMDAEADFEAGCLFVLEDNGTLLGAMSLVPENELDAYPAFTCKEAREIARVCVAPSARGRGLAACMVSALLDTLRAAGVRAVHLSAAMVNLPACKTYQRLGFTTVDRAFIYGNDYCLMEKIL